MARPIDPQIKVAALADLATGKPVYATAKKFKIARQTLINWRDEAGLDTVLTQQQRDQLGEAIDAWVVKAVMVLTKQLDLAMDLDWLRGHSPAEFATLVSVLADQVARLAETQSNGQAEPGAPTLLRRAS